MKIPNEIIEAVNNTVNEIRSGMDWDRIFGNLVKEAVTDKNIQICHLKQMLIVNVLVTATVSKLVNDPNFITFMVQINQYISENFGVILPKFDAFIKEKAIKENAIH